MLAIAPRKSNCWRPARSMAGDGRVVLWTLAKAKLQHQEVLELAEGGGCGAPGAAAAAAGGPPDGADARAHPRARPPARCPHARLAPDVSCLIMCIMQRMRSVLVPSPCFNLEMRGPLSCFACS